MATDNQSSKTLAENLYKQGVEILGKNKTLSLLNELYEISVLALEPKEIAARVSKTIQTNMTFELVGILLYDRLGEKLTPIAFVSSERLDNIQENAGVFFEDSAILLSSSRFLKSVIQSTKMGCTEEPADIWGGLIPREMIAKIQSDGHVKSSFVYSLMSREKVIGVLVFSMNRSRDQLLQYEIESVESFVNVVAVPVHAEHK